MAVIYLLQNGKGGGYSRSKCIYKSVNNNNSKIKRESLIILRRLACNRVFRSLTPNKKLAP